jgi:hypothetical protein
MGSGFDAAFGVQLRFRYVFHKHLIFDFFMNLIYPPLTTYIFVSTSSIGVIHSIIHQTSSLSAGERVPPLVNRFFDYDITACRNRGL